MLSRRLIETVAMLTIGDSVLCMLSPRRHLSIWQEGPEWWKRPAETLARYSTVTRVLGLAGLGFGLWLAWRQGPTSSRRLGWTGRVKEALT